MPTQRTQDPARGTDLGSMPSAAVAQTLVRELAGLCEVLADIADRLSAVETPTADARELPGPLGLCPPVDGSPVTSVTTFIDVPAAVAAQRAAEDVSLKALLRERHWQTYRTFCREYDRAAKTVDPCLVGTWPSRAQLHRWTSGGLKGLPYPDHCRVLEAMFPGHTVEQMFPTAEPAGPAEPVQAPARLRVVP